jgi:hypothetical protein
MFRPIGIVARPRGCRYFLDGPCTLSRNGNARTHQLAADPNAGLRRFVRRNCVHNDSERLFATHIAAAATPFSSRLRHGFVASATQELATETSARLLIGAALGRSAPISRNEFAQARHLFGPLLAGGQTPPHQAHRAAINAAFGRAYVTVVGNPSCERQRPDSA